MVSCFRVDDNDLCYHCILVRISSSYFASSLWSCSSVGQKQVRERSLDDCTSSSYNADTPHCNTSHISGCIASNCRMMGE
jgi:hypothetical protein